jgi:hypothetical protein
MKSNRRLAETQVPIPAAAATAAVDPVFADLEQEVMALVNDLEQQIAHQFDVAVHGTAQVAVNAYNQSNAARQGKTLPWFKHGIKGFLNKVWHGNHASNPQWQGESKVVPLQFYSDLLEQIEITVDELVMEADAATALLQPLFRQFKQQLAAVIQRAITHRAGASVPEMRPMTTTDEPEATPPAPAPSPVAQKEKEEEVNPYAISAFMREKEPDPARRREIARWLNTDKRHAGRDGYLTIRPKFRYAAKRLMDGLGLEYSDPADVKKIWPAHKDVGIELPDERERAEQQGLNVDTLSGPTNTSATPAVPREPEPPKDTPIIHSSPKSKRVRKTDAEDVLDHTDPDMAAALKILEGVSPAAKARYFRELLRLGL